MNLGQLVTITQFKCKAGSTLVLGVWGWGVLSMLWSWRGPSSIEEVCNITEGITAVLWGNSLQ